MPRMSTMIKNVFVSGRMHALFVPNEEDFDDEYNIFEALQAQAERIELLEEQNDALVRQGHLLLQLLELSSQTGHVIKESLAELKNLLNEENTTNSNLLELANRLQSNISSKASN